MITTVNTRRLPSDMTVVESLRPGEGAQAHESESPPQELSPSPSECVGCSLAGTLHHKSRDQTGKPRVFDVLRRVLSGTFRHGFETMCEFFVNTPSLIFDIEGKEPDVRSTQFTPIYGILGPQIRKVSNPQKRISGKNTIFNAFQCISGGSHEVGFNAFQCISGGFHIIILSDYTYSEEEC